MLFLRKSLLSFKSIPRAIIFGAFLYYKISKTNSFVIDISHLMQVYEAFLSILKHFKNDTDQNEFLSLSSFEENQYSWKKSKDKVIFKSSKADLISIYQIELDYAQFNEFLYAFYSTISILTVKEY